MLVLSRKVNEELIIGENVSVKVVRLRNGQVKLGIVAPRDVSVVRGELIRTETTDEEAQPQVA